MAVDEEAEDLVSSSDADSDEPFLRTKADPYDYIPGGGRVADDENDAESVGKVDVAGAAKDGSSSDEIVVVSAKLGSVKPKKKEKKGKHDRKEKRTKKDKKDKTNKSGSENKKNGKREHSVMKTTQLDDCEPDIVEIGIDNSKARALAEAAFLTGMRPPTQLPNGKCRGVGWLRQRRRQKAMREADEAARSMLEQSARRAAEWREKKTAHAVLAMSLEKKVYAARSKKKAKRRQTFLQVPERTGEQDLEYEEILQQMLLSGRDGEKTTLTTAEALWGTDRRRASMSFALDTEILKRSAHDELKEMERRLAEKHSEQQEMREEMLAKYAATFDFDNVQEGGFTEFDTYDASNAASMSFGQRDRDKAVPKDNDDSGEDSEASDQGEGRELKFLEELGPPPQSLLSKEEFGDKHSEFVSHFIRYVMGAWKSQLLSGKKVDSSGMTSGVADVFNNPAIMKKTEAALMPLLLHLRKNSLNEDMLGQLDLVVSLAAQREYASATQEYVNITMGKKTWFQAMPQMMMQQNHGGSVARIIKQSAFLDFDKDPEVNAYILALKRLIQYAQYIRPPTNAYKASQL